MKSKKYLPDSIATLVFLSILLVLLSIVWFAESPNKENILSYLATVILAIVVVYQFQRQAREFSLRSFQDAFFQLLQEVKEEKNKVLSDIQSNKTIKQIVDSEWKLHYFFDKTYTNEEIKARLAALIKNPKIGKGQEEADSMPATSNILHLIYRNLGKNKGELKTKDAKYYTKIVADVLGYSAVWEYYFVSAREIFKCQSERICNKIICEQIQEYHKVEQLGFFQTIQEPAYAEQETTERLKTEHDTYRDIVKERIAEFCLSY